jgi:hypothetical protein
MRRKRIARLAVSKFSVVNFLISLQNVKEHATLSAGAGVDHGVGVESTGEHENRAADRGCCVSTCSVSWIVVAETVNSVVPGSFR